MSNLHNVCNNSVIIPTVEVGKSEPESFKNLLVAVLRFEPWFNAKIPCAFLHPTLALSLSPIYQYQSINVTQCVFLDKNNGSLPKAEVNCAKGENRRT